MDIITDLAFGEAFGCLKTGKDVNGIISGLQEGYLFAIILSVFPWIGNILSNNTLSKYLKPPDDEGIGLAVKVIGMIMNENNGLIITQLAANIVNQRYKH